MTYCTVLSLTRIYVTIEQRTNYNNNDNNQYGYYKVYLDLDITLEEIIII